MRGTSSSPSLTRWLPGCALVAFARERICAVTTVPDRDALFAAIDRRIPDLILLDGDVVSHDRSLIGRLRDEPRWNDVRVIVTAPWAAVEDTAPLPPGVR